jgi:hypothetical protein
MSYRDSPLSSLFSTNTFNIYSQIVSTTEVDFTEIANSNWFLIYSPATTEIVNVIVRTANNKIIQLLDNAGAFSSNANNYSITGMPRLLAYLDGGVYRIFVKAESGARIEPLYTETTQSLVDYGTGEYPTGYDENATYDTLDTAGYSTSDRFLLFNTTEAVSSSTGALIVSGGIGAGSVHTGNDGITTSHTSGGFSRIYTDSKGYLNFSSSSNAMIITSSNLQFKVQRTDDLNISTLSNAPVYSAGAISSLAKIGCRDGLYVNPTSASTAYSALTYNSGETTTEISTLNGGITMRNPPNYAMFLNGKTINATFTKSTYGGVCTTSGNVALTSGYIWLNESANVNSSIRYNSGSLVDSGLTGSVSFYMKTDVNYSNPPTNTVTLAHLYGSSANADIIKLYHFTSGYLKLQCTDVTRAVLFDVNLATFSPIAGTEYFISIDWDLTNGSTKVFINGTQFGSTITAVGARDRGRYISVACPSTASFGITFFRIFNDLTYTSPYTPPTKTNYNLVEFPYDGGIKIHNSINNSGICELTSGTDGTLFVNGSEVFGYFDPSTIINFTNTENSVSTSTGAITISGGIGIGKDLYVGGTSYIPTSRIETATIYNSISGNDGTITNDGNGYLLISSQNGSKIKTTTYYKWYAGLSSSVNADYTAYGTSLSGTTSGDAVIDSGMLLIGTTASSSVYWANIAGIDGGNTGCINFQYMPLYTSTPADTITIIQFVNSSGNVNKLQLYHLASGSLKFQIYDASGASIGDITWGSWTPTNGQLYELEINWKNNETRMFIDGVQYGATNTSHDWSTRTGVPTRIRTAIGSTGGSQYKIGKIQIYNEPQHTLNYTPFLPFGDIAVFSGSGITIPNTTNSSSVSTGSLVLSGGIGIAKDLYVGGTAKITGETTLTGATVLNGSLTMGTNNITSVGSISLSGSLITTNTTSSTSTSTGALQVAGGVGIGGNLNVGGTLSVGTYVSDATASINGYITIKDAAGNDRYIACVTPT